jgi:hypothetical protein
VAAFVQWYNHEHQHSAIRFVTPAQRHDGLDVRISPKSITRFGAKRSPVSIQSDQPFRLMSITGCRAQTRG